MFSDPELWVGIAFLLFLAALAYLGVPALVAKALDDRAARIAGELEEARTLRDEAQKLLAEYEKKRKEAEGLAQSILAEAKSDAEAFAAETRRKMAEQAERRTRLATQKIAQAEAGAVKEVRAAATDVAIAAATRLIGAEMQGARAGDLIDDAIGALRKQLN